MRLFPVLALTLLLGACAPSGTSALGAEHVGSGVRASETRALKSFDAIRGQGALTIIVRPGPKNEVRVEGDDNLLPHFRTDVSGRTLRLGFGDGSFAPKSALIVTIEAPAPSEVRLAGAISADIAGVEGESFQADLSGACQLRATGAVERALLQASGAARIDASELETKSSRVSLSGSCDARIHARDSLKVDVSGAAVVRYRGEPELEVQKSGVASVEPEG